MAIVKPTVPSNPPHGRTKGSLFFRARGRTLARRITIPVNPITAKRAIARGRFARASKVYAYVLSAGQREQYAAFSKFEFRGNLEYSSTAIVAALTGQAEPLGRGFASTPTAPIIEEVIYQVEGFDFKVKFEDPSPADDWAGTAAMTPPRPESLRPTARMFENIFGAEDEMKELDLKEPYLDHFNNVEPLFRELICRVQALQRSTPASTLQSVGAAIPDTRVDHAEAIVNSSPIPKLGTSSARYFIKFLTTSEPDNITLRVTTPDCSNTFPSTMTNDTTVDATITDTLGVSRTSMFRFVASTAEGESAVLVLPVRIAF